MFVVGKTQSLQINGVFKGSGVGNFYTTDSGSFPVTNGDVLRATITDFTVTGFGIGYAGVGNILIYKNGALIQNMPVNCPVGQCAILSMPITIVDGDSLTFEAR